MRELLVILLAASVVAQGEPNSPWQGQFQHILADLGKAAYVNTPSAARLAAEEIKAASKDPSVAAPAIVGLWLSNRQDVAELNWWRHQDRTTRTLVVALYYCASVEPISGIPPFPVYVDRFRVDEAAERKEEIEFVESHLSSIAEVLARVTDGIRRAEAIHGRYVNVARAQIGKPLSKLEQK